MSRDAKVGLVIVFAFVFLFGTILVHRLHSNPSAVADSDDAVAIEEGSAETQIESGLTEDAPLAGAHAATDAAVIDGVREEEVPATFDGGSAQRTGAASNRFQRSSGPATVRKPSGEPSSHQTGSGQIVLTDRPSERRPAAVVESSGTVDSEFGDALEVASSSIEMPDARADDVSEQPAEPETEPDAEAIDASEIAQDDTPTTMPETEESGLDRGRRAPPPGVLEVPDAARSSIHQAAGNRPQPASPDSAPTKPSNIPDAKPSVESVGDEFPSSEATAEPRSSRPPTATEPRGRRPSALTPDNELSGQKTYVVREGDSFWTISARFYGTGKYFRSIEECNRDRLAASGAEPRTGDRQLVPGTTVVLPDVATLRSMSGSARHGSSAAVPRRDPPTEPAKPEPVTSSRRAENAATDIYNVQEGDTLSTISQRMLGTSKRWEEIFQLNRDKLKNPNQVRAGMELKLPAGQPAESIVERPYPGR